MDWREGMSLELGIYSSLNTDFCVVWASQFASLPSGLPSRLNEMVSMKTWSTTSES